MEKIKVLLFAANPRGTDPLELHREFREIDEEIRLGKFRDALELIIVPGTRLVDLLRRLNEDHPHIVHFSGHGNIDEEIILETGEGDVASPDRPSSSARDMQRVGPVHQASGVCSPRPLRKSALVDVLKACNDENIRVVVLNACHTRPQAEAISEVIDCAISMNRAISDVGAIKFAASFYGALAFGRSVKNAFDQGLARLRAEGISETDIPELVVRAGVDASTLVLVGPRGDTESNQRNLARAHEVPGGHVSTTNRRWFWQVIATISSFIIFLFISYNNTSISSYFFRSPPPDMPKDINQLRDTQGTSGELAAHQVNAASDDKSASIPNTRELVAILDMKFNALVSLLKEDLPGSPTEPLPGHISIARGDTKHVDEIIADLRKYHESVKEAYQHGNFILAHEAVTLIHIQLVKISLLYNIPPNNADRYICLYFKGDSDSWTSLVEAMASLYDAPIARLRNYHEKGRKRSP